MIQIHRNTYHCQGKGSWLKLQIGLTCILFMAFWRKPSAEGFHIGVNMFAHGSNRFGFWFFRANKNSASWYWVAALLLMLTGCGGNNYTTQESPVSNTPCANGQCRIPEPGK